VDFNSSRKADSLATADDPANINSEREVRRQELGDRMTISTSPSGIALFLRSLAARVTLGTVLLALLLVGLTAGLSQREFGKQLEATERHALVNAVHGLAEHMRTDILEHLRHDAATLAAFPSLLALAEGVNGATAHERAKSDLASFLRSNPHYADAFLVSFMQPDRRLVHSMQDQHRPAAEPGPAAGFADTSLYRIGRGLSSGQTYLSEVELKRKDGRILEPFQPVIHAVAPLHDAKGVSLGILVLQLDLAKALGSLRTSLREGQSLYLFNAEGYCLAAPPPVACSYGFEFPGNAADPELPGLLPAVHREIDFLNQELFSIRDSEKGGRDVIAGVVRLPFDSRQTQRYITVAVTEPYASALASATAARTTLMPMLYVVALATILLAILAAVTLTRPLRRMTASVRAFADSGQDLPLPTGETNEIGTLARAFEQMREEVRARADLEADSRARQVLIEAKAAAELDAKQARALAALLRLSLQPMPMPEYLQASLDSLLDNVPWLTLLPKGAIFLEKVGAGGTAPELALIAERNLSAPLLTLCARVPHGKCLCGRAAATREIQFARCLDERHEIAFDDMAPHGHYNLPILGGESLLGVLVLYLPHDYAEQGGEREFLSQVADVLALGIAARQSHAAIEEARAHAEAGERAKSDFLATMSHEIRTPLNGILGMAQLLSQSGLTREQEEFAQTLLKSGNALLTILNDIIDFSNIDAGRMEALSATFDLERSVADIAGLMAARAAEKGLELHVRVSSDCPRLVIGDAGRVRQVLLNLLGNAVKFTDAGHIDVAVECTGQGPDGVPRLRIAVRDTGIGIAPEKLEPLFQPFSRGDSSNTRKAGGTGLGLAISKRLVELMGGTLGAESSVGGGSTFWFILPLPTVPAITADNASGKQQPPAAGQGSPAEAHLDRKPLDNFRAQFGSDFAPLVDVFLESTPPLFDEMSAALAENDAATLRRHAHSLKSSAATYGALHLSAMARMLEHDAADGRLAAAQAAIAALRAEYDAVATELRSYLES
jgi:signal transduction histidine kinase/HPt (histidine-containing phosphotransfer) domain-containing protein